MNIDLNEGFNWDEIKKQLEKAIKLERDDKQLSITIKILEENVEENKMVGEMLQGEEEMKKGLGQFLGKDEPLDCEIKINQEDRSILMTFQKKKEFKKVYKLLNDMFFGDFFKKMIEAMMQAFGQMFSGDGDGPGIFGGLGNPSEPEED